MRKYVRQFTDRSSAESYQSAALFPNSTLHYLTTAPPSRTLVLPSNIQYLLNPAFTLPFPFPSSYFSRLRSSRLPSLVASNRIPAILRECARVLVKGGVLELRVMDATPVRSTMGPKLRTWMEERLELGLEERFKTARPTSLMKGWVKSAGFQLVESGSQDADNNASNAKVTQLLQLPTVFQTDLEDLETELAVLTARGIWMDMWGDDLLEVKGTPKWWWEDESIAHECRERGTMFEIGVLVALKL
jgi:hypothetical protein